MDDSQVIPDLPDRAEASKALGAIATDDFQPITEGHLPPERLPGIQKNGERGKVAIATQTPRSSRAARVLLFRFSSWKQRKKKSSPAVQTSAGALRSVRERRQT